MMPPDTSRPAYNFRILPELGFAIFVAVMIALAEALIAFDDSVFADPLAWVALLVGAFARAIGGALLTVLTKGAFLGPGQAPERPTTG